MPAGVGDGGDAVNGAIEENGDEGSGANVDREGANGIVVLGDPISEEVAFWCGPSVAVSGRRRRRGTRR